MTTDTQTQGWFSEETATFGDRLAGARENAGLSVADLAAQIGVSSKVIDAWEADAKEPRANRLQMLAGLLGVSLSWLMTGAGEGPEAPEDTTPITPDVAAILGEMRALRQTIARSGDRLAVLEKRLRKQLTAA